MATKRIDITVCNGQVKVKPVQGYAELKELEGGKILIVTGSWKITVAPEHTIIYCSSKAVEKKRKFKLSTMNGSLFLYNSTNNWYWYFRRQKLQFILDMEKIDSVRMTEWNFTEEIPCCVSVDEDNNISESTVEKNPTLKYFGRPNVQVIFNKAYIIDDGNAIISVKFKFDKFVLVEFMPNHRKLYVNKHYKIEDLFKAGYFEDVEMISILDNLSIKRIGEIE